jgi:decaprenylphospho-beta-D-erythro-pentofuranosid-2-ulose 2-reductase
MISPEWKYAIVVGASSGIGEKIARKLAATGCRVALVGRREDRVRQIAIDINGPSLHLAIPYNFDVTDFENATQNFEQIVQDLGGLDIIVYAAGVMPPIGPTEYDTAKDKQIIETNLIGAMAWLNPAAKRFERGKAGVIVGIGSPSGDRGRRKSPAYGASKAGLECYFESLRNRLATHGVSVVTVKPGPIDTDMTRPFGKAPMMTSADRAADLILKAAKKPNKTAYIPWRWWLVMKIVKLIPSSIFRRMRF